MTDDQLFPWPTVEKRPKAAKPDVVEVKVRPPWVVLRSSKGLPTAHVVTDLTRVTIYGGLIADCGATALALTPDGEPVARACPTCLRAQG